MSRRLLFDQNLAPRLVGRVAAEFPGSFHVRDLDLHAATDAEVLRVAAERDLVIVTKDKDFADIVTARGGGPKVLWLVLGNLSTDHLPRRVIDLPDRARLERRYEQFRQAVG